MHRKATPVKSQSPIASHLPRASIWDGHQCKSLQWQMGNGSLAAARNYNVPGGFDEKACRERAERTCRPAEVPSGSLARLGHPFTGGWTRYCTLPDIFK